MRLVTIDRPPSGRAGLLIGGDRVLDIGLAGAAEPLAAWAPASLAAVIAGGADAVALLRQLEDKVVGGSEALRDELRAGGALTDLTDTPLLAPIPRPGILLSHGRAYRSHVAEMKPGDRPPDEPIGFLKNANAVIGPGAPIRLPAAAPAMVDFEAEISVVFGRDCHGVAVAEALDNVLGLTIVNDVSARDWVPEMARNPDLNRMGKQFAGFAPMGPAIVTLDEFADIDDLHLVTRVNGEVMQDARTRDLIWSLSELVAYYARWYPFRAGDVLTSGTPAGVGYGRDPKRFLQAGDVVAITVDGIGELANPVVASPPTDLAVRSLP